MQVVSCRRDFSNPNQQASELQYGEVDRTTFGFKKPSSLNEMVKPNQNVLILIHGYNNEMSDCLSAYRKIEDSFRYLRTKNPYNRIIGFTWPGGENPIDYFGPRSRTKAIAPYLTKLIEGVSSAAKAPIDLMCHSMGARLTFQALDTVKRSKVRNCFSMAAAVENESIESGQKYYEGTKKCKFYFVFHSRFDPVLKYAFTPAEQNRALGLSGPEHPGRILRDSKNARIVNCEAHIRGHGDYKGTPEIYNTIANHVRRPLRDIFGDL